VIGGWLLKVFGVIALIGFVAVEVGSPVVTRVQLDGVAHDVADGAMQELRNTNAQEAAAGAQRAAAARDAVLEEFVVDPEGLVHVTVGRQARSVLLKSWSVTAGWYDVEVTATGQRGEL